MKKKRILYIHEYNRDIDFYATYSFWSQFIEILNCYYHVDSVVFHCDLISNNVIDLYQTTYQAHVIKWERKRKYRHWIDANESLENYLIDNNLKPDLIYCQNSAPFGFTALKLGRKLNIPVVIHEHTAFYKELSHGKIKIGIYNIFNFYRFLILNRAKYIIVPTDYLKQQIEHYRFKRTGIYNIPNPIASSFLESPKFLDRERINGKPLVIATWSEVKNLPRLIRSLNILNDKFNKNISIDVVGYIYPHIERQIQNMNLSCVNFLGHKNHGEIKILLEKAPYLIISSNLETFSLPVIEAMALGVPVVSTKCGGPEELLDDDRGLLADQDDEKFCDMINRMDDTWMKYDKELLRQWVINHMSIDVIKLKIKRVLDSI